MIRPLLLFLFLCGLPPAAFSADEAKPNVLFIAIDDLNDWVDCLGGHPQAITPHIDALAKRGVLFRNAHCNAPVCGPSRVSLMTSIRPSTSGNYVNDDHLFRLPGSTIREAVTLPQHLAANGYSTLGCGKLFHNSKGLEEFQTYGPVGAQGPLPKQTLNIPKGQSKSALWDWGVFPETEGDAYHDIADAKWTATQLSAPAEQPFFLGCGFYRPHVPLYAPQRFFDMHPLHEVRLPEVLETDREDIPTYPFENFLSQLTPQHDWFVSSGRWRDAIQAYLACISFTDENVGKVLSALDAGPHANNTWIILFSDHGFFLGEKQRWAKQSLWERATKVPLVIVPPKNRSKEFAAGKVCDQPVELLSLFPTLIEACGLPQLPDQVQGVSLMPLLKNPQAAWPHPAITTYTKGNHAVRDTRFRYIRYADGSEELYDLQNDPAEWKNLAADPAHAKTKTALSHHLRQLDQP